MTSKTQKAFTLVELLVVIALIGIIVAFALISSNLLRSDRNVQDQVYKLASIMAALSEESQMQGREFGLEITRTGYRFVEFDPLAEVWAETIGDDLLQAQSLEEDVVFELIIEDRQIALEDEPIDLEIADDDKRDTVDDYLPHIWILSSGDISPFQLNVVRATDNATAGLKVEIGGIIEVIQDESEI